MWRRPNLRSPRQRRSASMPKVFSRSAGLSIPAWSATLPATRDEALSLAMNDNPNVISANFTELAARDSIDVVRGQLLPQISVVGTLSRSTAPSVTLSNERQDSASATLQLTMPLYEGGISGIISRQINQ